jgi:hypothetical protein
VAAAFPIHHGTTSDEDSYASHSRLPATFNSANYLPSG